jgi:NDP-sugar pyrophosphorylase family protein
MFQELIDRGFPVHGLEVNKGWREIHTLQDVETAEAEMNMISLGV